MQINQGLSQSFLDIWTSLKVRVIHVRVLPGLHWQSWDFPGSTQSLEPLCQSIPEQQSYIGSPKIVQGLPNPLATLCQSIQPHCSYTGSAEIIPGLPTPWYPLYPRAPPVPLTTLYHAEYSRMPKLHHQSQDCPGTSKHPGTPVSEYPRTLELHRQLLD